MSGDHTFQVSSPRGTPSHHAARPILTAVIVICGGVIFFEMETTAVKRSLLNSQHVTEQNEVLKGRNAELLNAKKHLEEDEEE